MHSTLVVEEQYTYSSTKYACINSPQLNEVVDSLRVLLAISTRRGVILVFSNVLVLIDYERTSTTL